MGVEPIIADTVLDDCSTIELLPRMPDASGYALKKNEIENLSYYLYK